MEHEPHMDAGHEAHGGGRHEGHSTADFARRFWVSLVLTVPIVLLSPELPFLGENPLAQFSGATELVLVLSSVVFFYGGWPFLKGLVRELRGDAAGHDDAHRRRDHHRVRL